MIPPSAPSSAFKEWRHSASNWPPRQPVLAGPTHYGNHDPLDTSMEASLRTSSFTILNRATVELVSVYRKASPGFDFRRTLPRRCLTIPSEAVSNGGYDNSSHDLILRVDDMLIDPTSGDGYLVVDILGMGTFGQVAKCWHQKSSMFLAVKIVKNQQAYFNQAWVEINILKMLHRNNTSENTKHIVRFLHHFIFHGHLCLVFEKLNINLYELLKQNRYAGVSMDLLRTFVEQLLKALNVLVACEVVHCDVKPENILLSSVDTPDLKLIDFGSACQLQHPVYTYVQSRFYRSPEVLLGSTSYDSKIDMWSLGCVTGELFLGIPMFPGHDGMNMVCRISEMLGDFPDIFLRRCRYTLKYYNESRSNDDIRVFQLKSLPQYEAETNVRAPDWKRYFKERRLRDIVMAYPYQTQPPTRDEIALRESLLDLLQGMLQIDPLERWTPAEALQHPFITHGHLVNGQPWHPPGRPRRSHHRTRPAAIVPMTGSVVPDTQFCSSAPNFAGFGLFPRSSLPTVESRVPDFDVTACHMPGAGSFIPGPSFPAFSLEAPYDVQTVNNETDFAGIPLTSSNFRSERSCRISVTDGERSAAFTSDVSGRVPHNFESLHLASTDARNEGVGRQNLDSSCPTGVSMTGLASNMASVRPEISSEDSQANFSVFNSPGHPEGCAEMADSVFGFFSDDDLQVRRSDEQGAWSDEPLCAIGVQEVTADSLEHDVLGPDESAHALVSPETHLPRTTPQNIVERSSVRDGSIAKWS